MDIVNIPKTFHGGLASYQIPFSIENESTCKKTEQLIRSLLDLSCAEYPVSQTRNGGEYVADTSKSIIKQQTMLENEVKPHHSLSTVTDGSANDRCS